MVTAPQLPNATNVLNVPGLLSYSTVTSVADAVAFYQKQLPALGWQQLPASPGAETGTLLYFTQGDQQLSVIINADGGSTSVHILLQSVPKGPVVPTKPPTRPPVPTRTPNPTSTPKPTVTPKP